MHIYHTCRVCISKCYFICMYTYYNNLHYYVYNYNYYYVLHVQWHANSHMHTLHTHTRTQACTYTDTHAHHILAHQKGMPMDSLAQNGPCSLVAVLLCGKIPYPTSSAVHNMKWSYESTTTFIPQRTQEETIFNQ